MFLIPGNKDGALAMDIVSCETLPHPDQAGSSVRRAKSKVFNHEAQDPRKVL